ncbi:MAG: 50S ribosomal protein L24 [Parcubacteria group bacterium]|nr:50S ribosomal protein L24 [Parcubacteria group bacterium]
MNVIGSKIKKGDTVLIISGKDRGRKGKVLRVFPQQGRLTVEGMNMRKKHTKPRRQGEKGQVVQIPAPFSAGKAKLVCSHCGKATRVGFVFAGDEKHRTCKKCGVTT